jgi:hypothetical protein
MSDGKGRLSYQRCSKSANLKSKKARYAASFLGFAEALPARLGYASTMALQRCTERQITKLLRRAGNPRLLTDSPLMGEVCAATGKPDAVAALEYVVSSALTAGEGRIAALRDAIFEADFQRSATNAELAARNGVSLRHFQRRRAEAVALIARFACAILGTERAEAEVGAVARDRCGRRYDAGWRFNRERAAFLRARDEAKALEMRSIAANLFRLAATGEARATARECLVEANVHLGEDEFSSNSFVRATLALVKDQPDEAEEHARRALDSVEESERYACIALISQARLMGSRPWWPPPETQDLPLGSWARSAMDVEYARHRAFQGRWSEAERLARAAQWQAEAAGHRGLSARCAAVLCACADARGAMSQSRRWCARAFALLLATHDCVVATGLFLPNHEQKLRHDDPLVGAALYDRLCLVVPQMLGETPPQRSAVLDLIAELLRRTMSSPRDAGNFDSALMRAARVDSALTYYLGPSTNAVAETLALAVVAMTRAPWSTVRKRAGEVVVEIARKLAPPTPRAFPILVPQGRLSQSALVDHLRNDDERSPDLRFRRVPLRSGARSAQQWRRGRSAAGTASEPAALVDSR